MNGLGHRAADPSEGLEIFDRRGLVVRRPEQVSKSGAILRRPGGRDYLYSVWHSGPSSWVPRASASSMELCLTDVKEMGLAGR